jgi:hypothetical protein
MNSPEMQFTAIDRLIVGFCGVPLELVAALNLCRRFDGVVLYREKDVMVIEIGSDRETIDELLAKLPQGAVTHLWRSGPQSAVHTAATIFKPNFCGILP